jgi:hypothetical protein
MTKTKLLLAGVLAGAVAFGTACKTDKGTTNTGTDTTMMGTDAGTGGAGMDDMDTRERMDPLPEEGTREMEPGVHDDTLNDPGTGGAGMDTEPMDPSMDRETSDEPLNPGAPANTPQDDGMMRDDGMTEPKE